MTKVEESVQTLRIVRTETIAASAELVWESLLHHVGPGAEFEPGKTMSMTLEAFPGGRWFRNLGDGVGHLWGHVQVIKPNKLLELSGPMFMSFAATSHVQYKIVPDGKTTRLEFCHTAIGLFPPELVAGMNEGWGGQLKVIREGAENSAPRRSV